MVRAALVIAAGLALAAPVARADELPKQLAGEWTLVSGSVDGVPVTKEQAEKSTLTLKGDTYAITGGVGTDTNGTFKVDMSKSPAEIDATGADGKVWKGIIKVEGDVQTVALAPPGKPRPTEFASPAGSGIIYHVWKKK